MLVFGKSWVGRVRSRNEDVYWLRPELNHCGVADGMGGFDSGHIAARMTADSITMAIREQEQEGLNLESLMQIVKQANRDVYMRSRELPDVRIMGATLVMLQFVDEEGFVCHAGDARCYRLREGSLDQLTRDHSVINEKIDRGEMTLEEAIANRISNQVTQGIGPSQVVSPTITEVDLSQRDLFLLCSDGLTGFVDNQIIETTMNQHRSNVPLLLDKLIDLASEHGSTDNITVVLAEVN